MQSGTTPEAIVETERHFLGMNVMQLMRLTLCLALLLASLLSTTSCATTGSASHETAARELLRLHEDVLRAHRESNVELLLEAEGDEYVIANRGEVTTPPEKARKDVLGPYLQRTRFSTYKDRVPPIVKVSADGSLGWVIAQVEARGEQTAENGTVERVEFVSAWIELYEKRKGRWFRVGNVSNFKADE
jgi:hypothetical protein